MAMGLWEYRPAPSRFRTVVEDISTIHLCARYIHTSSNIVIVIVQSSEGVLVGYIS